MWDCHLKLSPDTGLDCWPRMAGTLHRFDSSEIKGICATVAWTSLVLESTNDRPCWYLWIASGIFHLQVIEIPLRQGHGSCDAGVVRMGWDLEWQKALGRQGCDGCLSQVQNRGDGWRSEPQGKGEAVERRQDGYWALRGWAIHWEMGHFLSTGSFLSLYQHAGASCPVHAFNPCYVCILDSSYCLYQTFLYCLTIKYNTDLLPQNSNAPKYGALRKHSILPQWHFWEWLHPSVAPAVCDWARRGSRFSSVTQWWSSCHTVPSLGLLSLLVPVWFPHQPCLASQLLTRLYCQFLALNFLWFKYSEWFLIPGWILSSTLCCLSLTFISLGT